MFFRSLGGAVGLAAYGAVLTASRTARCRGPARRHRFPTRRCCRARKLIRALPEPVSNAVIDVSATAITTIFLVGIPVMAAAFVLPFVHQGSSPLRETSALSRSAEAPEAVDVKGRGRG